jgi:hypothetical protein
METMRGIARRITYLSLWLMQIVCHAALKMCGVSAVLALPPVLPL